LNAESVATSPKFLKDLKPGDTFLNYRLVKELGRGGFGSVLRGVKMGTSGINPEDHVAIKILHPAHANQEKLVHRFHREAKLAKKMSHPHVVRIFDDGVADGIHYIVMELAEGKTLLQYLMEGDLETPPFVMPEFSAGSADMENSATITVESPIKLDQTLTFQGDATIALPATVKSKPKEPYIPQGAPVDLAVSVLKQCASVLQSAQTLGLLHRDLKPENILIRKDKRGQVQSKILDFGLAKNLVDESLLLSVEGQAVGTPAYMSPEQFRGETLDIRSDLYSLGATFYTFVTLTKPFPGPAVKDFMEQILNQKEKPAHEINRAVDTRFSCILDRLMQKNPALRHQTPDELIEDLSRYTRGEKPLKSYLQKKNSSLFPVLILAVLFFFVATVAAAGWWCWKKISAKIRPATIVTQMANIAEPIPEPKKNPGPVVIPAPIPKKVDPPLVQEKPTEIVSIVPMPPVEEKKPLEEKKSEPEKTPEPIAQTTTGPAIQEQASTPIVEPPAPVHFPKRVSGLVVPENKTTPPPADFAPSPVPVEPAPKTSAPPAEVQKETPSVVVGYTHDFTQGTISKPVSERVQDILKRRSGNFEEQKMEKPQN
jgi:serine/threonine protein kinase